MPEAAVVERKLPILAQLAILRALVLGLRLVELVVMLMASVLVMA